MNILLLTLMTKVWKFECFLLVKTELEGFLMLGLLASELLTLKLRLKT